MTVSRHRDGLLLGREPVLWFELLRAVLPVAVLFGLPLTPEQTAGLLLVWSSLLALITRSAVTPNASVAEHVVGGKVVAGPANDRELENAYVRNIGGSEAAVVVEDVSLLDELDGIGRGEGGSAL